MRPVRTKLKLKKKTYITKSVIEFVFTSSEEFEYNPGQYINILIAKETWRSYSILNYENNEVILVIDISPGGKASVFFEQMKEEDEVIAFAPLGHFELIENNSPKIFAATGTGIAPLIPMIRSLQEQGFKQEAYVFFGASYDEDCFVQRYLEFPNNSNFKLTPCISKSKGDIKCSPKRITETLFDEKYDLRNFDGYVCGGKEVVEDVSKVLTDLGCVNIYSEKY